MSTTTSAAKHEMFCRLKRVELSIMGVLWNLDKAGTVREVFEELYRHGPWSFNTVRTTMSRMERVGVLKQGKKGRSNVYVPRIGREEAAGVCVEAVISEILGGKLGESTGEVLKRLPLSTADRRSIKRAI